MFLDGFVRYVTEFVSEEREDHTSTATIQETQEILCLYWHTVSFTELKYYV